MSRMKILCLVCVAGLLAISSGVAFADGDPERGAKGFRQCAACHSLAPGRHKTGPSLANIWGRKAGTIEGFSRYSEVLKHADVVWDEETLDAWLADPQAVVPKNRMIFRSIEDAQARADLIAYLKVAAAEGASSQTAGPSGMQGDANPNLKALGPEQRVTALHYCGDTYTVTTEAGETHDYWEFNLRFKSDSSDEGPSPGKPALLRASMMGDRAFVIFAGPKEISPFIKNECPKP